MTLTPPPSLYAERRARLAAQLGPGGVAWEKTVTIAIPDPSPLAVPVLRDTVVLAGPPGAYTFAANLERGGAPAGWGRCRWPCSPT